jgi:hypothetical protein
MCSSNMHANVREMDMALTFFNGGIWDSWIR